ncbi:Uncharacterized protein HZ326_31835, partial [Fusarium oxysporum f. sp. albedinis]
MKVRLGWAGLRCPWTPVYGST